jgi:hypothetical protein
LKGTGDIFCVAFLSDLSNFWLLALIGDKEDAAKEVASPAKPCPFLFGDAYCKNTRMNF